MKFKRYCKTLNLYDNAELINRYQLAHAKGQVWPEIEQGMRDVGIIDMEIYIHGTTLFMILDTLPDFEHDKAFKDLATKPRQKDWELLMAQFQRTPEGASADEKWQLMDRIYELGQKNNFKAIDGQRKEF